MDIPWAVEQVHTHSSEVVHKDMVRLVVEELHSPQEQVGWVHILQEKVYSHSQGSGEEHHWKLRSTCLVSQTSFCYS